MANLKEDDLKDLGLDIGEEIIPETVGGWDCCEHGCQNECQEYCESYSQGCVSGCQSTCLASCQGCEDHCERFCQNGECGSCQSCQTCQTGCQVACQDAAQKNSAPNMPSSISVPSSVKGGETINITWGAATDPDGNLSGYILEKKTDSAGFSQIYKGSS